MAYNKEAIQYDHSMQKVLHIHDSNLDDPRIICAAMTGAKNGYEPHFCGIQTGKLMENDVFKSYTWLKSGAKEFVSKRLFNNKLDRHWHFFPYPINAIRLEKELKQIAEEIRPDIIHAHNIFIAYHCHYLGIPMVFDDHEFFSLQITTMTNYKGYKRKIKQNMWRKKEMMLGEHHPVITVSTPISRYYEQFANRVYTVPNFPMQDEINPEMTLNSLAGQSKDIVSAYLGADSVSDPNPVRDIAGLHDLFTKRRVGKLYRIGVDSPDNEIIKSFGYVPMRDAYHILTNHCHIGLIPWKRHWFHPYCCPNKSFEYAHAGCLPMITDDFVFLIDVFSTHCDITGNYDEMARKLEYYNDNREELDKRRLNLVRYAKNHLSWENKEHLILEAYRHA
jgi:glycosyltransferase involved in cell wall biosynthesis